MVALKLQNLTKTLTINSGSLAASKPKQQTVAAPNEKVREQPNARQTGVLPRNILISIIHIFKLAGKCRH